MTKKEDPQVTTEPETNSDVPEIDEKPFIEANEKAKAEYGRFNLAIIGNTGVGKSSLVNAVFGRDLAKVGKGLPVTQGVHYFKDDSLGIWDIEGFETGKASPAAKLREHLQKISEYPADQQISVVWYCVQATADRLTQADIDVIRELDAKGLPVILVLTKVDWGWSPLPGQRSVPKGVEEFRDWLVNPYHAGQPIEIPYQRVILTSTTDKNGKGAGHGLGELVDETLALSPDNEKDAFRIAQRLNLPWKREMARAVVGASAAASAGAAAIPFPVADAALLAPIQLTMMGKVAAIYDLDLKTMMSAGTLAQLGVQISGRALARSFLKLIPGAGSVIGATVAFALTAATGEGWLRLCEQVHTGKIDVNKIAQSWGAYAPSLLDVVRQILAQKTSKQ